MDFCWSLPNFIEDIFYGFSSSIWLIVIFDFFCKEIFQEKNDFDQKKSISHIKKFFE